MTSVAAWIAVDSRGPSSAYIATDSRLTWGASEHWDYGRKAFASSRYPDISAYVGDVLFPSMLLSQYTDVRDADRTADYLSSGDRFAKLVEACRLTHKDLPANQKRPFTIVHVSREGEGMVAAFQVRTLTYRRGGWETECLSSDWERSTIVRAEGSGRDAVLAANERWESGESGGTSRACFSAFVDSLAKGGDAHSGGAPQLVALYRKGPGRSLGVIQGKSRFISGLPIQSSGPMPDVEWRNELFERCDGVTRRRLKGAQRHQRPA